MQTQKSISLSEKTWSVIDNLRGNVPRSKFVDEIIAGGLEELYKRN